jgi:hypothetical protein
LEITAGWTLKKSYSLSEPVFLNVYGAPESIPRNEFRQRQAGRYDNPLPPRFLAPIDSLKIPAQGHFTLPIAAVPKRWQKYPELYEWINYIII